MGERGVRLARWPQHSDAPFAANLETSTVIVTQEHLVPMDLPAEREAAFEAAFLQHYGRVYGVLYRVVGERTEAEDLTVEVFWRLWQWLQRDRGQLANPGGWLYRVATRLGYNAIRAAKRRASHEDAAGHQSLESASPPGPELQAQRADERAAVRRVLSKMRPRDASLLLLRHSGLSYREIAEAIGVSANSVGKLLVRAERQFEKLYAHDHPVDAHGGSYASQR